jgi:hypothetical protein
MRRTRLADFLTPGLAPGLAPGLGIVSATAPALLLAPVLLLAGCGDLPQPFAGRPGATALRLANPPPARLVIPAPTAALLPPPDAATLAHDLTNALVAQELPAFAEAPQPGDWQIRVTAELTANTVTPRFALYDAGQHQKGQISGAAIPARAWAAADPAVLQQAAAEAAPQITALLRAVDASIKQSDPNSLYNRPARIFIADVTGAPGNGNMSLARQMRIKLPDTGDLVVGYAQSADFTVRGTVRLTQLAGHQQQVEIHWLVYDLRGNQVADVAQIHAVEQGLLDHMWGAVAEAVASEAAGGVHDVITNASGRRRG